MYENFTNKFPEVSKAYNQLGISTREAGPLEPKIQDLIKLGIAIGANSRGAVMSHTRNMAGIQQKSTDHSPSTKITPPRVRNRENRYVYTALWPIIRCAM